MALVVGSIFASSPARSSRQSLIGARRDLVIVATLISAMALLIWNGNSFVQRLSIAEGEFSETLRIAAVALSQRRADPVRVAALCRPPA